MTSINQNKTMALGYWCLIIERLDEVDIETQEEIIKQIRNDLMPYECFIEDLKKKEMKK